MALGRASGVSLPAALTRAGTRGTLTQCGGHRSRLGGAGRRRRARRCGARPPSAARAAGASRSGDRQAGRPRRPPAPAGRRVPRAARAPRVCRVGSRPASGGCPEALRCGRWVTTSPVPMASTATRDPVAGPWTGRAPSAGTACGRKAAGLRCARRAGSPGAIGPGRDQHLSRVVPQRASASHGPLEHPVGDQPGGGGEGEGGRPPGQRPPGEAADDRARRVHWSRTERDHAWHLRDSGSRRGKRGGEVTGAVRGRSVAAVDPQVPRSTGTSPMAANSTSRSRATLAAKTAKTSSWVTGATSGALDPGVEVGDERHRGVAEPQLAGEGASGYWVMLTTSQPSARYHGTRRGWRSGAPG